MRATVNIAVLAA